MRTQSKGRLLKAIREEHIQYKAEIPLSNTIAKMHEYSLRTTGALNPVKSYLNSRQALVDWLSGVGDSLKITNQAVHHAVLVLDLYASKIGKQFDIVLASLGSLLASAKFVQMKYPCWESLNSATNNAYEKDDFIEMEGHILRVIDW